MSSNVDALKQIMEESEYEIHYRCPKCKDKHSIDVGNSEVELCDCVKDKMWEEVYYKSNIPKIYWSTHMGLWNTNEFVEGGYLGEEAMKRKRFAGNLTSKYANAIGAIAAGRTLNFVDKNNKTLKIKNLLFSGGRNSGKTMLASLIAISAVRKGLRVKFYSFSEMINVLSDFNAKEEQSEIKNEWINNDLIIVDNLVSEYNNLIQKGPFVLNFNRLAEQRLNSGKPIIITAKGEESISNFLKIAGSSFNSLIESCLYVSLPSSPHIK